MDSDRRGLWEGQFEDDPGTVAGCDDLAAAAPSSPTGVTNSLHARHPEAEIDYVHGTESLAHLGTKPGNVGLYLPAMRKKELFRTVILDGALPRKTFSMGESHEKRFYMEARKLI